MLIMHGRFIKNLLTILIVAYTEYESHSNKENIFLSFPIAN